MCFPVGSPNCKKSLGAGISFHLKADVQVPWCRRRPVRKVSCLRRLPANASARDAVSPRRSTREARPVGGPGSQPWLRNGHSGTALQGCGEDDIRSMCNPRGITHFHPLLPPLPLTPKRQCCLIIIMVTHQRTCAHTHMNRHAANAHAHTYVHVQVILTCTGTCMCGLWRGAQRWPGASADAVHPLNQGTCASALRHKLRPAPGLFLQFREPKGKHANTCMHTVSSRILLTPPFTPFRQSRFYANSDASHSGHRRAQCTVGPGTTHGKLA